MRVLNPNLYKCHIPTIKRMIEKEGDKPNSDVISLIAIRTGMPVLAVCMWVQCLYGVNSELTQTIDIIQEYYKFEHVVAIEYERELE